MSLLKVDTIRNRTNSGAPEFDLGINIISGISSLSGVKIQSGILTSITNSGIVTFYGDGSGLTNVGNASLSNSTISGISLGSNLKNLTPGNYITGSNYNGGTARTFNVDATSSNTANKVVARDSNGDFSSRYITATKIIKSGGTSSQFLKADGSTDSNSYITSSSIGNGTLSISSGIGVTLSSFPSFTANQNSNKTILISTNATTSNTPNRIVLRGTSGQINVGAINASTGNFSGNVTSNGFLIDGESGFLKADGTVDDTSYLSNAEIKDSQITFAVNGSGFSVSASPSFTLNQSTNKTVTFSVNSTSTNTGSSLVFRDSNGDFSAEDVTVNALTGTTISGTTISGTNINSTSDINLKKDITEIKNSLDILTKINGVNFKWKKDNNQSLGVIAQNVEEFIPQIVSEINDVKSVNYNGLVALLIESVKELKKELDYLKNK
jgi:hypothetical protein